MMIKLKVFFVLFLVCAVRPFFKFIWNKNEHTVWLIAAAYVKIVGISRHKDYVNKAKCVRYVAISYIYLAYAIMHFDYDRTEIYFRYRPYISVYK